MTENDIKGNFAVLREMAEKVAGADLPDGERETVKMLALTSLALLESFFIDVNRAANALDALAYNAEAVVRRG